MNASTNIPDTSVFGVISYDILVENELVDPGLEVISIVIQRQVNKVPVARLVIRDGSAADESFAVSNMPDFTPGKKIKIKFGRDSNNVQVFDGLITSHSVKANEHGQSNLMLECKDACVKMTLGRKSGYFEALTDQQIMEQLIGSYALTANVQSTSLSHKEMVQHHATDWDFLVSRAEANGMFVMAEDGTVHVKKPDTTPDPELALHYGQNLLEFEACLDARHQWKKVSAFSWDYSNQELFEAESENVPVVQPGNLTPQDLNTAFSPEQFRMIHSGQVLEAELQEWADASLVKSRLAGVQGRARVREGFAGFIPGGVVEIRGVGDKFNGKAFITAVIHEFGDGKWDTHIQFGHPLQWFNPVQEMADSPAAGLLPGVSGLQVGKVVQLENDPDGEDRIRVKLPVLNNQSTGIWCRIATLDAGNNRGSFFRPEVDDEVIVGFINDDPRDAVVLGMMNSSAKPAPLSGSDANHEKGIFTRSSMRVHFNDSTKTITIDTPAGNSIQLDEGGSRVEIRDQNQNTVKMGTTGIELTSPLEIKITAGTSLTLAAGTTLAIGGTSVSVKADGQVGVEGATAKFASMGITEVNGSLVKIN